MHFSITKITVSATIAQLDSWCEKNGQEQAIQDAQAYFDLAAIYAAELNIKLMKDVRSGKPLTGSGSRSAVGIKDLEIKLARLMNNRNWRERRDDYSKRIRTDRSQVAQLRLLRQQRLKSLEQELSLLMKK